MPACLNVSLIFRAAVQRDMRAAAIPPRKWENLETKQSETPVPAGEIAQRLMSPQPRQRALLPIDAVPRVPSIVQLRNDRPLEILKNNQPSSPIGTWPAEPPASYVLANSVSAGSRARPTH